VLQRDMEEELGDGQPMFLGTWTDRGRIADADALDKQRYVRRVRRNTWSRSAPPPRAPLSPLLRSSPLGHVARSHLLALARTRDFSLAPIRNLTHAHVRVCL